MRLIDADAFDERVRTAGGMSEDDLTDDFKDGVQAVLYMLSTQPTIEERKRGKWKRTYLDHESMGERPSIFYCSSCNQCIAYPVNFCPNCGADMRGGM